MSGVAAKSAGISAACPDNITLVLGPNSSGKSLFAEGLAVESGTPRLYLATMVPHTQDNLKRIEKHRIQRQEKGFSTIEIPWNLDQLTIASDAVVLLEDMTNLLANGIFDHHQDAAEALRQIKVLAARCRKLIIVSIAGLINDNYTGETADYIDGINRMNEQLSLIAETVYEMQDGKSVRIK